MFAIKQIVLIRLKLCCEVSCWGSWYKNKAALDFWSIVDEKLFLVSATHWPFPKQIIESYIGLCIYIYYIFFSTQLNKNPLQVVGTLVSLCKMNFTAISTAEINRYSKPQKHKQCKNNHLLIFYPRGN